MRKKETKGVLGLYGGMEKIMTMIIVENDSEYYDYNYTGWLIVWYVYDYHSQWLVCEFN